MPALRIEKLTVRADRMVCQLRLDPRAPRTTNPALVAQVLRECPTILHHSCVNDSGDTFASVVEHTAIPHLIEHMVIDLQVRHPSSAAHVDTSFTGVTYWLDETAGLACVEVSYVDDLAAIGAFRQATRVINKLVVI